MTGMLLLRRTWPSTSRARNHWRVVMETPIRSGAVPTDVLGDVGDGAVHGDAKKSSLVVVLA